MGNDFLTTTQFAEVVGLRPRAARLALQAAGEGRKWRGARLNVQLLPGRGGAAGLAYHVEVASIPAQFIVARMAPPNEAELAAPGLEPSQNRPLRPSSDTLKALQSNDTIASVGPLQAASPVSAGRSPLTLRSPICGDTKQAQWRLAIIHPIRQRTEPRTAERAQAILAAAEATLIDWRGRRCTVAERTIRDWIERYEGSGIAGLMRKTPKNAGERRVHLSRQWDAAARSAGLTDVAMADLVAEFRRRVRGEWAKGTPSWPTVQLNTLPRVIELTRKAGVNLADLEMRDACKVPRTFIERERRYALVATKNKDAGRFAAEVEPRIKRHRDDLRPGDWYAGDVHHLDLLFRVGDRVVTPKAVAWVDLATNRAWLDIHILPKGEMIRTEHVIQSYVRMCSHPNWGTCSRLYVDNGGEYNWTDLATDLCKLKHSVEVRIGEHPQDGKLGVQRARAYNPQAKHIEGFFAALERVAIAQLDGAIGGERMRKKTTNHGQDPTPFPGDEAQLRKALMTALDYYHTKPQSGHLKGKSPNELFATFVASGWTATTLDPHELAVAFSQQFVKPVRASGRLRLDGTDYRADALQSLVGSKVLVRQPMFGDRKTLFIFSEFGEFLCIAAPENAYAFGISDGAAEQGRRSKLLADDIRSMEAEADATAGGETAMENVVEMLGEPARAPLSGAVIRLNPEYSAAARAKKNAPAREADEADRYEDTFQQKSALWERLVANGG